MKVVILFLLLGSLHTLAQTPNADEWLRQKRTQRKYLRKQIAALKVYTDYLKKGYAIARKGLTVIGDVKDGSFTQDKTYVNSLKEVSPVVAKAPANQEILEATQVIQRDFQKFFESCTRDPYLTPGEVDYIRAVYQTVVRESDGFLAELTQITSSGNSEMKEEERLHHLDKIRQEILDQYAFTQQFIGTTRILIRERAKEENNLHATQNLLTKP